MRAANLKENSAWKALQTRADWERFRDSRIHALRESLCEFPRVPKHPRVLVTRTVEGDGFRIENLVFEGRPGLPVSANLYVPAKGTKPMPGILISHSHHNPKSQGELQDMGMTWARQGCLVLVPDHLGHGERRQHPFKSQQDYPRPFRAGRQDYYFRYNAGVQLSLVGESLMGWMVWDLMRGLDLLLSRPGIDKDRVILLGAVAGGGDPAAVTAALDPRVKALVPFNFGGPQPDYAIPANRERDFYYFGIADWESTRCLRLGARDGFAHWVIVGSLAPRRLIYAHEFAWDREHDPVWPRLRKIFDWYDAADRLGVVAGRGTLRGSPPESSHCNNIGPLHRSGIYPILERWFGMPIPAEFSRRRAPDELLCMTPEAIHEFRPRPLHELAAEAGAERAIAFLRRLAGLRPEDRRQELLQAWAQLLGDVEPKAGPVVREQKKQVLVPIDATFERIALEVEKDILVPLVLIRPATAVGARHPVVMGLAHEGKQSFLEQRSEVIADLIKGGVAVCLVDVRGTGETGIRGDSRRYHGAMTEISASEWLLGQTLAGAELRDVRSVMRYLRSRADIDAGRVALWGDSFAPPNPEGHNLAVPLDVDAYPHLAEPLGGLLALLGALFEDSVRAVYVRGGLASYASLLRSPFCYVPHDALIPGALKAGDLPALASGLAPRPLRMDDMVDGLDRVVPVRELATTFEPVRAAYRSQRVEVRLQLDEGDQAREPVSRWLLRQFSGKENGSGD
jgi:dienelactone hydrolase